jgi:uncharacterized damage-inducible protein DinB
MFATTHFRAMARNNAWSNHSLLNACGELTQDEFAAKRISFFPSLQLTLNHILLVDWYYLDGLEKSGRGLAIFENKVPFAIVAALAVAQRAADIRLIRYCDDLTEETVDAVVSLDRGEHGIHRERVHAVLAHLFVHQIHHRGQAHAMLAGTRIQPPQLDEFFLAGDAPLREHELNELGLRLPT